MKTEYVDNSSRWLIHCANYLLGIAFAITLLILAWNNIIDVEKREFAIESAPVKEIIFRNLQNSNDLISNFTALISSTPQISENLYNAFARNLLDQGHYIEAIYYADYSHENQTLSIKQSADRNSTVFQVGDDVFLSDNFDITLTEFMRTAESSIKPAVLNHAGKLYFILLKQVLNRDEFSGLNNPDADIPAGLMIMVISPDRYININTIPESISVSLVSDTSGIGGRSLLLERAILPNQDQWIIQEFSEADYIQFPSYSVKLNIGKLIYWEDIDKKLLFIVLILGVGVTLLLVSLQRSKDAQEKELRERNIVIEKKVEEQTRDLAIARDQALDASRMKSDFLSSMSHEIRTPLNAIIGMSELLSETRLSEEQEKYVNIFRRAGDTLLTLVNDILDLSKIEAKQMHLESIGFCITDMVEEAVEIYALKAAEKNIELISRIAPGLNVFRIGDSARLRQIILNLISNGLKFTDEGEILVYVSEVENSPDKVKFSVSDTGIGIPEDKCAAIFESFTQADASTTRKYGGTGLGLTICKSLVELMQGKIWVESEQGKGSTFNFIVNLPVDNAITVEEVPADLQTGRKILLVNNNATNTLKIKEIFNALGVDVETANTGEQAIGKVNTSINNNESYQLIIINSHLADMEGHKLVGDLVSKHPGINLSLMLNPAEINDQINIIKQYGVTSYLVKPVKQAELKRLVSEPLNKEEILPANDTADSKADLSSEMTGKKILLVDDNPDNRLLIKAYLKKVTKDITEAENGKMALDLFQSDNFNLVLMDIHMPEMDGHEATIAIRKWEDENKKTRTPIIALTAHATNEEIEKCINSGCDIHLGKPVKKAKLLETLREFI